MCCCSNSRLAVILSRSLSLILSTFADFAKEQCFVCCFTWILIAQKYHFPIFYEQRNDINLLDELVSVHHFSVYVVCAAARVNRVSMFFLLKIGEPKWISSPCRWCKIDLILVAASHLSALPLVLHIFVVVCTEFLVFAVVRLCELAVFCFLFSFYCCHSLVDVRLISERLKFLRLPKAFRMKVCACCWLAAERHMHNFIWSINTKWTCFFKFDCNRLLLYSFFPHHIFRCF